MKQILLIALLLSACPLTVFGAFDFRNGGRASGPGVKFYGAAALKGGLGESGSESTSAEMRDQYRYGAELNLGLRFGVFLIGGSAEYNLWRQKTDPSEVAYTNMSGTQVNYSPLVGMGLGPFLLQLKTHLASTVTLNKKTSSGAEVSYSSPVFPAYSAQLNYRLANRTYIGIEYTKVTYERTKVDGVESKLSSSNEINYSGWGVVYGIVF